jgi:hypothetical protein
MFSVDFIMTTPKFETALIPADVLTID